ncbi:hypothetical protein F4782DRAFT_514666 [Xylaria castorea]|nr:hypothetical protein F4782DRAFT_514666 [Xylaria castorea]
MFSLSSRKVASRLILVSQQQHHFVHQIKRAFAATVIVGLPTSNTRTKMHSYPGLGLSLWHNPQQCGEFYPTGHNSSCDGSQSDILLVREVAMMHIMDRLTDKVDWHKKVFDDKIVAKWRAEALAYPDEVLWMIAAISERSSDRLPIAGIMTDKMFDYCIRELQGKVQHFTDTGIIPTLDATAAVAKSDGFIPPTLTNALRNAFERLKKDQEGFQDWHPGTDEKVLNLIHPSMYPLVFKSTKCFRNEVVGVADAVAKWAGKGTVTSNENRRNGLSIVPPEFWSEDYQWLPSNVALREDGSVKFTSYINNLHPTKYPEIYGAIEKLVEKALPMWDQCLYLATECGERECAGRDSSRFSLPENPGDDNEENWTPSSWKDLRTAKPSEADKDEKDIGKDKETSGFEEIGSQDSYDNESDEEQMQEEWREVRRPVMPEPKPFEKVDYSPPHRLFERFKDNGLQIIVKMVSIELTPEKPSNPVGSWHVEGQMNEHICATALYYLDSENVTTSDLSFRMQTDPYLNEKDEYEVGQDQYDWLERVHGTWLGFNGVCVQNYGSVETPEGRFLAFPNVFQHRVSSFQLLDPTKPGHRRFIALWLVDPHLRIISTANVPPQQQDWWVESVFGRSTESQQAALANLPAELVQLLREKGLFEKVQLSHTTGKLPVELMEMVRKYFAESPVMSDEEARAHRLKLMDERTKFSDATNESWQSQSYNFCEH